jgi:cytochrome c peroxidase
MSKSSIISAIIVLCIALYSCNKISDSTTSGTTTLDLPETPYVYYEIHYPERYYDSLNKMATLGRVLFYDGHLSLNNGISCASCHKQAVAFSDNAALSMGFEGRLTKRNSPGFHSLGRTTSLFWDGRETNINNLALRPITNHVEMGIEDTATLPAKLAALPYYKTLFAAAYGKETITASKIAEAIAVFMKSITGKSSRLDKYNAGFKDALTAQELYGMELFDTKYNCGACHLGGGSIYGGTPGFKDIGLDKTYADNGRGDLPGQSAEKGKFKVPNLANVALTAPYMHDGRFKTLSDVLDHYSGNIQNSDNLDTLLKKSNGEPMRMNISAQEKQAIIAFLGTLTDYSTITDPKFSNPFQKK